MRNVSSASEDDLAAVDPTRLHADDLELRLARLVELEAEVSGARKALHLDIDAMRAAEDTILGLEQQQRLDEAVEEERQLSRRRHVVHWLLNETREEAVRRGSA